LSRRRNSSTPCSLSGTPRLSPQRLKQILDELDPLKAGPSPTSPALPPRPRRGGLGQAPETVQAVAGPMLRMATTGLPSQLAAALKHAASFHNPEFYRRQNQRFTTFFTPAAGVLLRRHRPRLARDATRPAG
jgi:hypothetical protein